MYISNKKYNINNGYVSRGSLRVPFIIKLINEFNKVIGYKVSKQKSIY